MKVAIMRNDPLIDVTDAGRRLIDVDIAGPGLWFEAIGVS